MVTEEEYLKAKADLAFYAKRRTAFLVLALVFLTLFLGAFVGAVLAMTSSPAAGYALSSLASMLLTAMIAFFVLRGVLYRSRIEKRLLLIAQYESER